MPTLSNEHYGFEGVVYWSYNRFAGLNLATGSFPSDAQINAWLTGANKSEQPRTISISVGKQVIDLTGRWAARNGYRNHLSRVSNITVRFNVFHNQTDLDLADEIVKTIYSPREVAGQISLAFLSEDTAKHGIVGHFECSGSKQEPLRGLQQWQVTAVNSDYISYWRGP